MTIWQMLSSQWSDQELKPHDTLGPVGSAILQHFAGCQFATLKNQKDNLGLKSSDRIM